ncbi:hypothetical protein BDC45DRAFT_565381 [Circinella umbellata]|nr:hypothetical protein BDC45DRAFT_565381 [Circinella umbellata]
MAPRRIYNNNNNNGGRVVTLGGGGGGLNERFSQLDKPSNKPAQGGSVFSRLRTNNINTNKPGRRNVPSIQNRLSKPVQQGGIRKRNFGTSSSQGPVRGNQRSNRGGVTRGRNSGRPGQGQQRNTNNNRGQTKQQRGGSNAGRNARGGRNKNDNSRKPVTAQDLDKSLDAYMMKDAKTAQTKLDDELDSYMDESGDVLMDL